MPAAFAPSFVHFLTTEIVNSLGLEIVCNSCLPSVQPNILLEWRLGKGDLGPQITRKVGGGRGSKHSFCKSSFSKSRVCFLGNRGLHDTPFITHPRSHVQSELVEAARHRWVLFSFNTAQNHLTILTQARWEKRNRSYSEKIWQPLPLQLLTEVFKKGFLIPILLQGKSGNSTLPWTCGWKAEENCILLKHQEIFYRSGTLYWSILVSFGFNDKKYLNNYIFTLLVLLNQQSTGVSSCCLSLCEQGLWAAWDFLPLS